MRLASRNRRRRRRAHACKHGQTPSALRKQVTSPRRPTTEAAIDVLGAADGLGPLAPPRRQRRRAKIAGIGQELEQPSSGDGVVALDPSLPPRFIAPCPPPFDPAVRRDLARAALSPRRQQTVARDHAGRSSRHEASRPVADLFGATLGEAVDCVEEAFDRAIAEDSR